MKHIAFLLLFCLFLLSCRRDFSAPVPNADWDLFFSAATRPLTSLAFQKMDGVYAVEEGAGAFGELAPAKWSYTVTGQDTTFHLSFFFGVDAAYMICEGKRLDSTILLNGYWRRLVGTQTGKVQLTIPKDSGAAFLLRPELTPGNDIYITGVYGNGNATPDFPLRFRFTRPIIRASMFEILAHRGGGRTADLLPASENSVEMLRLASRFGATGVEIDVQLTKDEVPVLFHDATLNERVVQKSGLLGPVKDYTFDQLSTLVRLTNGERIPTLRQALETIVYQTPLDFVWLDTKYNGNMQVLRDLQAEYLQKAAAINRRIEIVIGIPDKEVMANFKKLPDYQSIPSIVEYSETEAEAINARIWAPQWTLGLQDAAVDRQQAQGRRVFTWTMDIQKNISQYINEGKFNGILSNYPSLIAYTYYARQ
ncbi:MAG TPA: glycerophosphodiester phosphodiesterase [Flavisolibacter sp.]|jgi:glycerophosphoryl diester phosphodiesterase|nr:glycerophosphodiester phosphodiesterase [Flavisolibacter sp.]